MPTALQLPYVRQPARRVGGRTYLKQILPLADVEHPQRGTLSFTRERLRGLVDRFRARAFDMVPFVLASGPGHVGGDDPERVRGTVRDLELAGDGLYARIDASERGARLIDEHPNLPVSVRIAKLPGGEALAHVLATLDPVARGMAAWRPVELSAGAGVIDLSHGSFAERRGYLVLDGLTGDPIGMTDGTGGMVELSNASDRDDEAEALLSDLLELSEDREREQTRELLRRWERQQGRI